MSNTKSPTGVSMDQTFDYLPTRRGARAHISVYICACQTADDECSILCRISWYVETVIIPIPTNQKIHSPRPTPRLHRLLALPPLNRRHLTMI